MDPTTKFFDEMAPWYDSDVVELGWSPVELVRTWPLVVAPGERVVDVGCGTGALLEHLAGAGRTLWGLDVSEQMLAEARRRPALREVGLERGAADATWPLPDGSVDVVFCLAVLEFVERLDAALDEAARVLRPGGRLLFTAEDLTDSEGNPREARELRYDRFPLWRRSIEDIDLCVPPGLDVVRRERVRGYRVLELGFTCAYHVWECVRNER